MAPFTAKGRPGTIGIEAAILQPIAASLLFDLISLLSQFQFMPQLLVRNLEDERVRHLREALLGRGAAKRKTFWQVLGEMPDVGDDSLFERERSRGGRGTLYGSD